MMDIQSNQQQPLERYTISTVVNVPRLHPYFLLSLEISLHQLTRQSLLMAEQAKVPDMVCHVGAHACLNRSLYQIIIGLA